MQESGGGPCEEDRNCHLGTTVDFKDLLNRDVRDFFGTRRSAEVAPMEARCAEASLVVRTREGGVDLVCLLDRAPLCTLKGRLDGPLAITPTQGPDRIPAVRVVVPLDVGASAVLVTVEHKQVPLENPPVELEPSWLLVESRRGTADGGIVLEFVFERMREEIRYRITLPEQAVPVGVREAEMRRVRYRALPSVSQMGAFLQAAARERGGAWRVPAPVGREPVAWMRAVLRQGEAERMDAVVAAWEKAGRREGAPFSPAGTEPLEAFLDTAGCSPPAGLVRTLCLYVEIEMERITRETFEAWVGGRGAPVVSSYAIEAVAQAFGIPLLALTLSRAQVASAPVRATLCALSPLGLLLGCQRGGEPLRFEYVSSAGDSARGTPWTGDVLLCPSIVEHVSARDLALFLRAGHSVVGCFQSDLDRRRAWKRLGPAQAGLVDHGFVDGFRAYHFQSSILGALSEGEERPGARRADVSLWRDDRGSLHYLPADTSAEAAAPLEATPCALLLPDAEGLPEMLPEMSEARRRGRVEGVAIEILKLDLLAQALTAALARPDRYRDLACHPDDMRTLRQSLAPDAVRPRLGALVDTRTLDELLAMVTQDPPGLCLRLLEPVAQRLARREVGEAAGLALLVEMCLSDAVRTRSGFKNFNRSRVRSELLDGWMKLAESRESELRTAGSILLGTSAWLAERQERMVVTYALNHALEHADEETACETATALVRLALAEWLPAPRLWELQVLKPASTAGKPTLSPQAAELARVADEMRQWLGRVGTCLLGVSSPLAPPVSPRGLSSLVAGARLALARMAEVDVTREWFVITSRRELEALFHELVLQWRDEVAMQGEGGDVAACLRDCAGQWGGLLEAGRVQCAFGTVEWWPWSGSQVLDPVPFWVWDARVGRTSLFFLRLVEMAVACGAENLRLVRWRRGEGMTSMQVLHAGQGRFVDLLELQEVLAAPFLDEGERAVLRSLSGGGTAEEKDETAAAREQAHAQAAVAFLEGLGDGRGVAELVAAFQLPAAHASHVARILEGVRAEWEGLRRREEP